MICDWDIEQVVSGYELSMYVLPMIDEHPIIYFILV